MANTIRGIMQNATRGIMANTLCVFAMIHTVDLAHAATRIHTVDFFLTLPISIALARFPNLANVPVFMVLSVVSF